MRNETAYPVTGETRIALIGIIVEDMQNVGKLNNILHEYYPHIIGRMGLPYAKKSVNIISVAVDAPENVISAISGKIGMLQGISTKTIYGQKALGAPQIEHG